MRILGLEIKRVRSEAQAVTSGGGWFSIIRESFPGAFQQGITVDAPREVLAFSAVYACVSIIAGDIAKLGVQLLEQQESGVHTRVKSPSPFLPVLRKPNRYQTWFKFMEQWIVSKLLYGNAYIIKERDNRKVVIALYVLPAPGVVPLVTDDGGVYYRIPKDNLSGLQESLTVPASEIIHDMMTSLWHPLVGVSPIYACGVSATQGNKIQSNSTRFFANASRPSGGLTAPGTISDEVAARLKKTFEENFSGGNIGRLFVAGDGLEYKPMAIPAAEAQLIEQLKWTVEDVARCFHVPTWKLGDKEPLRQSVESLNQTYYSDCLQVHIESAEPLLDEGLSLPDKYHAEFDLEPLLRMDTAARYTSKSEAVKGGWMTPNEARLGEDLPPVKGGDACYLQQQNYSTEALSKRDAKKDPFESAPQPGGKRSGDPALPAPAANDSKAAAELADFFVKGLKEENVAA